MLRELRVMQGILPNIAKRDRRVPVCLLMRMVILQQVEVVQLFTLARARATQPAAGAHLVIILHNRPLPRARVHPGHKVFHAPGDQHRGIGDGRRADAYMTLLDC